MTAKKNPADLRPRSVPTSSEERNSFRALLARFDITPPASVNGATLRTLYEREVSRLYTLALADDVARTAAQAAKVAQAHAEALTHNEALRIVAERIPAMIAAGAGDGIDRKKAVQMEAGRKAAETRRRNQLEKEARRQAAQNGVPVAHVGAEIADAFGMRGIPNTIVHEAR